MDRNALKNLKLVAASLIFVTLTLLKLLLPAETEEARAWICHEVGRSVDYQAALEAMGESVMEAFAPLRALDEPAPAAHYDPVTLPELREEVLSALPPTPIPTAEPAEPEAVAAFLETQAVYGDYEVPGDVSYELAELPFEYAAPVSGVGSSGFGYRLHPIEDKVKFHYGTDFAANSGVDVTAFAYGYVSMAGFEKDGYGNYVILNHGDGWQTVYAHCSEITVGIGEYVSMGQKIAEVGATGEATGPHLHFELSHNGVHLNPEFYLYA